MNIQAYALHKLSYFESGCGIKVAPNLDVVLAQYFTIIMKF